MGNRCFQNVETETEIQSKHLQFDKITEKFGQNNDRRQKGDKTNNLEMYLNDAYQEECVIKAEKDEVDFIKKAIEFLVQRIVDLTLENFSVNEKLEKLLNISNKEQIKAFQSSLVEVYFPIKTESRLKEMADLKVSKSSIIKVGSFYEETKNLFPDEFDFIFLLFYAKKKPDLDVDFNTDGIARDAIRTVTDSKRGSFNCFPFQVNLNGRNRLYLDGYMDERGPGSMLIFIYRNEFGEKRYIHVDLVPANMVADNDSIGYVECVKDVVKPVSLREEVLSVGKCLHVSGEISFTETEVHFMRNVLSKKHVKVYRILKFLINGHGDGEIYKQYLKEQITFVAWYSSYQLKTLMIYHHDECTHTDTTDIGPCVLQVLQEMCKYDNTDNFPKLYEFGSLNRFLPAEKFCLLPGLLSLTQKLRSMQISGDSYEYEKIRMKSVSKQYLDALDKDDSRNVTWYRYLDTLDGADPNYATLMEYLAAGKENRLTNLRNNYKRTKACQIL